MIKIKTKTIKILTILIVMVTIVFNYYIVYADDIDEEINEDITVNEIEEVSNNIEDEPTLNSRRCIIYDRNSKRILYGKNENVKTAMASTTKIMTAIVVLENCQDLNKTVTITQKAAGTGGSRLGLKTNDKITIHDLLYGLLLRSGNDAAVALAIEIGENVEGFADMMNIKAKELGLTNTHFKTPHGLDDPEHYTTAYELAKLTDYAMENEKFAQIVGTKNYTITINGYAKALNNTNELLGVIDGVVGVKTGFTNNAGRCLVAETKRGDMDIITVVIGADTKKYRTKDSIKLIEYAFSNFSKVNIKDEAEEKFEEWNYINSRRIEVIKGVSDKIELELGAFALEEMLVDNDEIDKLEYDINTIVQIEAPVAKNTKIGTLSVKLNGEIVETVDIICSRSIEKKNWWIYFKENLGIIFKIAYEI